MEKKELYSHSLTIDLRALGIGNVSDFVFIVHPAQVTLFIVTRVSHPEFKDRLLEVKISPALIQKLQTFGGDARDKVAVKESISDMNYLPPDILRLFLLSNHGLVVVTTEGIFYINQAWIHLLSFDQEVSRKYTNSMPSLLVKECNLRMIPTQLKSELQKSTYTLRHDGLIVEMSKQILVIRFIFSPIHPQRLHNITVEQMPKGPNSNFNILSTKNSLGTLSQAGDLVLYRYDPINFVQPDKQMVSENSELIRYSQAIFGEMSIVSTKKIRTSLNGTTSLSKFHQKESIWDYSISFSGPESDYFALIQDEARLLKGNSIQTESDLRFIKYEQASNQENLLGTLILAGRDNKPKYLSVNQNLTLSTGSADNISIPIVYGDIEHIVGIHSISNPRLFCQVSSQSILLRGETTDLKIPVTSSILQSAVVMDNLVILDSSLTISIIRFDLAESKITHHQVRPFSSSDEQLPQNSTAFSISENYLLVASENGFLSIYSIKEGFGGISLKLSFKSFVGYGSALLSDMNEVAADASFRHTVNSKDQIVNELEIQKHDVKPKSELDECCQPWRSITDPSWQLSFPLAYNSNEVVVSLEHILFENFMLLFIKMSSGELYIYKSIGWHHPILKLKFKRLTFTFPLNIRVVNSTLEKDKNNLLQLLEDSKIKLKISKIDTQKYFLSSKHIRSVLICVESGEVTLHRLSQIKEAAILAIQGSTNFLKIEENQVTLVQLYHPEGINFSSQLINKVHATKESILKTCIMERDGHVGLVVLAKQVDFYRLYLYDANSGQMIDKMEFLPTEIVVGMKKLYLENRNYETEEVLCITYAGCSPGGVFSKWRLVKLKTQVNQASGRKIIKLDPKEEYADQEANELITCVFNIGDTLFLAIENRIVQLRGGDGFKVAQIYYPNSSYIIDAVVNGNSVILTSLRGTILFLIWMRDQNKLVQKTEIGIGENPFLYETKFLDTQQAKVVTSDADRNIVMSKVITESTEQKEDSSGLKFVQLQSILLESAAHSMEPLKEGNGLYMLSKNGSVNKLYSRQIKYSFPTVNDTYQQISSELPYPGGVNPISNYELLRTTVRDKREIISDDILVAFTYLSYPLQFKVAAATETNRIETYNMILDCLGLN